MASSIESLILKILKEKGKPLTAKEIQNELAKRGREFTYYWVKINLDSLSSSGKLVKFKDGREYRYSLPETKRPVMLTLDRFIKLIVRDEIEYEVQEREGILRREERKIFEQTVEEWMWAEPAKVWDSIIKPKLSDKNIIRKFVESDPRNTVLLTLKHAIDLYNKLSLKWKNSKSLSERGEIGRKRGVLDSSIRKFMSYFGIPTEPSGITINFKVDGAEIVDMEFVETLLKNAIFGEKLIEVIKPSYDWFSSSPSISVGIDGTRFEISADQILGRVALMFGPSIYLAPVYINAAVAAWVEIRNGEVVLCDPRPTPEEWAEYTYRRAVDEGLIVTPQTLMQYSEEIWRKVAEAAMNAVEYMKAAETMQPPSRILEYLKGPKFPTLVILDGRLFPYEYDLDDYLHDHHEYVKMAIQRFNDLVARYSYYNTPRSPLSHYCGLVKTSPYECFKMLLAFWMLRENLIGEDEFWKIMFCSMPDGWLLWKIFSLLDEVLGQEGVFVTFRVRKFFATMVRRDPLKKLLEGVEGGPLDKVKALRNQELWNKVLVEYAERKNRPMIDMTPYAAICANASILTFFCDVPYLRSYKHIVLPRFEVLIPKGISEDDMREFDRSAVEKISSLFYAHKKWAVFYEISQGGDGWRPTATVVTREVYSAHKYAHDLGKQFKLIVTGLLEKALINILGRRGYVRSPLF